MTCITMNQVIDGAFCLTFKIENSETDDLAFVASCAPGYSLAIDIHKEAQTEGISFR